MRYFLQRILSSEDKTSKYEVDQCGPDPHTKILEVPDRDREYCTDIVPNGDEIGKTLFREGLNPCLLEARSVRGRIDRDHHHEHILVVRFPLPENDENNSSHEKAVIHPVDLELFPVNQSPQ